MKKLILITILSTTILSCKNFLEVKPDQKLVVPKKLTDLQALLDENFINTIPALAEGAADNYYLSDADFNATSNERDRNVYLWRNTADDGDAGNWQRMYNTILSCNVVLETLAQNDYPGEEQLAAHLRGRALFHRANNFFSLLMIFAKAYDPQTAATDLGIPLRLSSDFNQVNRRNTVEECFNKMITDLKEAASLLEEKGLVATRPDKASAYALLAKVCLFKQDDESAAAYAEASLEISNTLLDYNTLDRNSNIPFTRLNAETIFYATGTYTNLAPARSKIAPDLYHLYHADDLRKQLFFRLNTDGVSYQFKGSYTGQNNTTIFTGITTAEVLLTGAEALARLGHTEAAAENLNILLLKRYRAGTHIPVTETDAGLLLTRILEERRKELVCRGIRWYDLKRLNLDPATAVTLSRQLAGQTHTLAPGSKAYVFPIPQEVIERGGLVQNE